MKYLQFLVLILLFSCSPKQEEWILFKHRLLSISYPSSWVKIENDEMLLGIKKHTMVEAEFEGENPNVIISAIDTTGMNEYGYNSVMEYSKAFIEFQKDIIRIGS